MRPHKSQPIKIAIAALGGQGGGVLASWLVATAEQNDYLVQSTSVQGVAQRTGTTIYYLEMLRKDLAGEREPVFALYPVGGDVDIVLAAELAEAGRAIQRGFVTPDRTTLIASSHRIYSTEEKIALGDGRLDSRDIREIAQQAAKRLVCFDMETVAEASGSVISAVLLGAIAGADALPFPRADYEQAIRAGGRAVDQNLAAFGAGYEGALQPGAASASEAEKTATTVKPIHPDVRVLLKRVEGDFPEPCQDIIRTGLGRVLDYQDPRYGETYLNRLRDVVALDASEHGFRLTADVARYLALRMTYEDTIRVADLKTRRTRFERFRKEVKAAPEQLVYVTEFMHPRVEEICDTLPAPLGRLIMESARLRRMVGIFCRRGRFVQTTKLSGFLLLSFIASLRRVRRTTYRFKREQSQIDEWLGRIRTAAQSSYALAIEIAKCARLLKGYSDTHERGLKSYNAIMEALDGLPANEKTATAIAQLRDAALADEHGTALSEALVNLR